MMFYFPDALLDQEKRKHRKVSKTADSEKPDCVSHMSVDALEVSGNNKEPPATGASTPASEDASNLEDSIKKDLEEGGEEKDIFEPEEEKPSVFAEVFSDTEDEAESERLVN